MQGYSYRVSSLLVVLAFLANSVFAHDERSASHGKQKTDDAAAIESLIEQLQSPEFRIQRKAAQSLAANHGEFVVPYLLKYLGSNGNPHLQVTAINTLVDIGHETVVPLMTCIASHDSTLRRSIVMTLGRIADTRGQAAIQRIQETDPLQSNRDIANSFLGRMASRRASAHELYCELGEAYARQDETVLALSGSQTVAWSFSDRSGLTPIPVSKSIFSQEVARNCFAQALSLDPESKRAMAGLVAAYNSELAALQQLRTEGAEMSPASEAIGTLAQLGLSICGITSSADSASVASAAEGSEPSAPAEASANLTSASTLIANLKHFDKPTRYAAAIALAKQRNADAPAAEIVELLSSAVTERAPQTVILIDEDKSRRNRTAMQLQEAGYFVSVADNGLMGMFHVRKYGSADLLMLSSNLTGVSTDILLDEFSRDERTKTIPVFVFADKRDLEKQKQHYGEKVKQVLDGMLPLDMNLVQDTINTHENPYRVQAEKTAQEAAQALSALHARNFPTGMAAQDLLMAVQTRAESIAIPAAVALGHAGNVSHLSALQAIFQDTKRSSALRTAIATGMGGILSRTEIAPSETMGILANAIKNDTEFTVRQAAAKAIGNAKQIQAKDKAEILTQTLQLVAPITARTE